MEPHIQYAKTSDGVNIAYYELGEGLPFVVLSLPSHLSAEWRLQGAIYEALAKDVRLVRLDHRGFGLSDREPEDISPNGYVSDVEAVVDKLELSRFILFSNAPPATPIAIAYAARHPERVSRLLLNGNARTVQSLSEQTDATLNMPGVDWQFTSEALVRIIMGWDQEETARPLAELIRQSVDLEGFKRFAAAFRGWNISDLLPLVSAPTLVTNSDNEPGNSITEARQLTAGLQNAQLVILDGSTARERTAQRDAAVRAFLGAPDQPSDPNAALPQGTAVILFLDIAGSTALTTKLGDAAYREKERALDASLRSAITEAGGTPVEGKVLGDGVMAVFTSARGAIAAAVRCRDLGNEAGLPLHLGIHAGDVVREGNNVHGGAVQLAARVQSAAAPGEILVSDIVRGLARTSAGVAFEDRGEHEVKGIDGPQRLFAVRERA